MSEEWRAVAGYAGYYEVSDSGRVRSLSRPVVTRRGAVRSMVGRILVATSTPDHYPTVRLSVAGDKRTHAVHVLVATAFHGERPPGNVVRHRDGDSLNARATNLEWGTPAQNVADTVRMGRHREASRTHCKHHHEYTKENTAWRGNARVCRACSRRTSAAYQARKTTPEKE